MSSVHPGFAEGQLRRARAELEAGLRGGADARAEALLAAYPAVAADPEAAIELVYTEFVVRQQLGQTPAPAEWLARFPQWKTDLEQMFEVHDELCRSDVLTQRDGAPVAAAVGPPLLIPGYQTLGEVGRGGMGVVYKARDVRLNRVVAVKLILAGELAGAKERGRFRREAEAAARLDHPHIARVYEVGDAAGRPYCAMEFVAGGPLAARMTGAPWPVAAAAKLVADLARAADHAHQRGVVHRDIKPANVLLACDEFGPMTDESGNTKTQAGADTPHPSSLIPHPSSFRPKLVDFGLAKCLLDSDPGLTHTGDVVGTPMYMAPEQAAGAREVGPAADVWALGVILYELLTGRAPFRGETAAETRHQVLTAEPVPPRQLRARLPHDLDTICLRALQKDAPRRYPSAAALADDLDRWAAGKPIAARPVRWPEKVSKWARREPVVAGLAVAIAVVALAGLGGVLWQWDRANEGWHQAVDAGKQASNARDDAVRLRGLEAGARVEAVTRLHASQIARAALDVAAARTATAGRVLDDLKARDPVRCRWEWDFLKRQSQTYLVEMVGHTQMITSVLYTPDGKRVISSGGPWNGPDPGEVKVWDAATGTLLHDLTGPPMAVYRLALRPDGKELAAACGDGVVYRWDVSGPAPRALAPFRCGALPHGIVYAVAYHPTAPLLAAAVGDGTVQVWSTALDYRLSRSVWHPGNVYDVAYSPDGRFLASTCRDAAAVVRSATDHSIVHECRLVTDARRVVFSPDGRMMATVSHDGEVVLWDVATGFRRAATRHVGLAMFRGLGFSPDGGTVVCASRESDPKAWSVRGQGGRRLSYGGPATACAFNPDGSRFATARDDCVIQVWDQTAPPDPREYEWGGGWVAGVAVSPDGRIAALAGTIRRAFNDAGKVVGLVNLERGGFAQMPGHPGQLTAVAYRPDGKELASSDEVGAVFLWDMTQRKQIGELKGHDGAVNGLGYAPAGDRIATAGADKTARVWDAAKRAVVKQLDHPAGVRAVAFSSDGMLLATGCDDRLVRVYDAATFALRHTLPGHRTGVAAVAFRPGTAELATADDAGEVRFWDAAGGKDRTIPDLAPAAAGAGADEDRPGPRGGASLAFAPDGSRLATGCGLRPVQVWDPDTRRPLLDLPHPPAVNRQSVAFTPDGSRLVAAERVWVRVWDSRPVPVAARRAAADARVPAWHEKRFADARRFGEWFPAEFHADWLAARSPGQPSWVAGRGQMRAAQGKDAAAAEDHGRALALSAGRLGGKLPLVPGSAYVWNQWGEGRAHYERWDEVVAANQLALWHDPADVTAAYNLASAELARGNKVGYDAACAAMVRRFRDGDGKEAAYRTFQAVSANPTALDAAGWVRLGEKAQAEGKGTLLGGATVLGAAYVRAGRAQEAVRALEYRFAAPRAWEMLFRALAHRRLGSRTAADQWVARAKVWIAEADRVAADPTAWSWEARWEDWNERVTVAALLREAAE